MSYAFIKANARRNSGLKIRCKHFSHRLSSALIDEFFKGYFNTEGQLGRYINYRRKEQKDLMLYM